MKTILGLFCFFFAAQSFSQIGILLHKRGATVTISGGSGNKLIPVIWEAFDRSDRVTSANASCERKKNTVCKFKLDAQGNAYSVDAEIDLGDQVSRETTRPEVSVTGDKRYAIVEFTGDAAYDVYYMLEIEASYNSGVLSKVGKNIQCDIDTGAQTEIASCSVAFEKTAKLIEFN